MDNKYIFKILNSDNTTRQIIYFNGNSQDKSMFTDEEKEKVLATNTFIYPDDTIETIKKKLSSVLTEVSLNEYLLFYYKNHTLHLEQLYNYLTQNNTIEITYENLRNFILNIVSFDITTLPIKDSYSFDDLINLNLPSTFNEKVFLELSSEFNKSNSSIYVVNPFELISQKPDISKINKTPNITTKTKSVLMDNDIINNEIYVILAETIPEEYDTLINTYFPLLTLNNVTNISDLKGKKTELLLETKRQLSEPYFIQDMNSTELFYKFQRDKKKEINKLNVGITEISFIISPLIKLNIPIDALFKLIQTDDKLLLTKYNVPNNIIYRLFTIGKTKEGKQIPQLKKTHIYDISKYIITNNSFGIYHKEIIDDVKYEIIMEILKINGNVNITFKLSKPKALEFVNSYITKIITNIFIKINNIIERDEFIFMSNLNDTNIQIVNIKYSESYSNLKPLDLKKYYKCLSSAFLYNLDDTFNKGKITLIFKKVSYFNKLNEMDRFILNLVEKNIPPRQAKMLILEQFNLTNELASESYNSFITNVKFDKKSYQNKIKQVKLSSGFIITITDDNNLIFSVDGIKSLSYLQTIPIYLEGFVRFTNQLFDTDIEQINSICSGNLIGDDKSTKTISLSTQKLTTSKISDLDIDEIPKEDQDRDDDDDDDDGDDGDDDGDDDEFTNLFGPGEIDVLDDDDDDDDDDFEGLFGPSKGITDVDDGDDDDDDDDDDDFEGLFGSEQDGGAFSLNLTHPNPFQNKIEQLDPKIITKRKKGEFKAYSSSCPHTPSNRRQPLVLTQEEKDKIDKNHPNSYGEALKYRNNYYTCPRYYDLKNKTTLTHQEVVENHGLDKVLPKKGAKVATDSQYIFEWTDDKHIEPDTGEYIQFKPGFIGNRGIPNPHEFGLCTPCCFKNIKKDNLIDEKKCPNDLSSVKKEPEKKVTKQTIYIKDMNKFPLSQNDIAYLPESIQKMLNINNSSCQISSTDTSLISNTLCLLRKGTINYIPEQSFLGCISDFLNLSLFETKKLIIDKLTIEIFMKLQNGNLIEAFYDKKQFESEEISVDILNDLFTNNLTTIPFILKKKIYISFENYKKFILDNTIKIDYTYLWDIITTSKILFTEKINLIILEFDNIQDSKNINIICPKNTTHYNSKNFLLIIKKDNIYEPLYFYINDSSINKYSKNGILNINELKKHNNKFSPMSKTLVERLKQINSFIHEKCKSINFKTNFKGKKIIQNQPINETIRLLNENDYQILKQIINFNGKIVALFLQKDENKFYLPVEPSSILREYEISSINDTQNYTSYTNIINELSKLNLLEPSIPCNIYFNIIYNDMLVGVLTETNQFIPVINQTIVQSPSIKNIELEDIAKLDSELIINYKFDTMRKSIVDEIKLETQMYNAFRNILKNLLEKKNNYTIKKQLSEIIQSTDIYSIKNESVKSILTKLLNKYVKFTIIDKTILQKMANGKINSCLNKLASTRDYCIQDNGIFRLLISKFNLLDKSDNEITYFNRLSDEVLRFKQINRFIMNNNILYSLEFINYNLHKNEILLYDTFIEQYFEKFKLEDINKYIQNTNELPLVADLKTVNTTNTLDLTKVKKKKLTIVNEKTNCKIKFSLIVPTDKLYYKNENGFLLDNVKYKQYGFKQDIDTECGYLLFKDIYTLHTSKKINNAEIKQLLKNIYSDLDETKIKEQLIKEGKVKLQHSELNSFISNNNYYLTNLDLVTLFNYFKIPIIFTTSKKFTENNRIGLDLRKEDRDKSPNRFVLNLTDLNKNFYIIRQRGIKPNKPIIYQLFNIADSYLINISQLTSEFSTTLNKYKLSNL